MLERTFQDIGDDLHVAVTMCGEAVAGTHEVFVDNPQATKTHEAGIVVLVERKGVISVQPTVVEVAAFICFADIDHDVFLGLGLLALGLRSFSGSTHAKSKGLRPKP